MYFVYCTIFIELRPLLTFEQEDTDTLSDMNGITWFCSLLIDDSVILFGGIESSSQISQLYPWGLSRIGTLPFKFKQGRCLNWESVIYLCFDINARSTCYKR